jgi:hypothetical protein
MLVPTSQIKPSSESLPKIYVNNVALCTTVHQAISRTLIASQRQDDDLSRCSEPLRISVLAEATSIENKSATGENRSARPDLFSPLSPVKHPENTCSHPVRPQRNKLCGRKVARSNHDVQCCAVNWLRCRIVAGSFWATNSHGSTRMRRTTNSVDQWLLHCLSQRTVEPHDRTWAVIRVDLCRFVAQTVLISRAPRGRLGPLFIVVVDGVP